MAEEEIDYKTLTSCIIYSNNLFYYLNRTYLCYENTFQNPVLHKKAGATTKWLPADYVSYNHQQFIVLIFDPSLGA